MLQALDHIVNADAAVFPVDLKRKRHDTETIQVMKKKKSSKIVTPFAML